MFFCMKKEKQVFVFYGLLICKAVIAGLVASEFKIIYNSVILRLFFLIDNANLCKMIGK